MNGVAVDEAVLEERAVMSHSVDANLVSAFDELGDGDVVRC